MAVPALQELLLAEQLVVAACLQPGQQVQQHIAVVVAAAVVDAVDTSYLARESAAVHIGCAALELKKVRERQLEQPSFAVAELLEELEPERHASAGEVELADFACLYFFCF